MAAFKQKKPPTGFWEREREGGQTRTDQGHAMFPLHIDLDWCFAGRFQK